MNNIADRRWVIADYVKEILNQGMTVADKKDVPSLRVTLENMGIGYETRDEHLPQVIFLKK